MIIIPIKDEVSMASVIAPPCFAVAAMASLLLEPCMICAAAAIHDSCKNKDMSNIAADRMMVNVSPARPCLLSDFIEVYFLFVCMCVFSGLLF